MKPRFSGWGQPGREVRRWSVFTPLPAQPPPRPHPCPCWVGDCVLEGTVWPGVEGVCAALSLPFVSTST